MKIKSTDERGFGEPENPYSKGANSIGKEYVFNSNYPSLLVIDSNNNPFINGKDLEVEGPFHVWQCIEDGQILFDLDSHVSEELTTWQHVQVYRILTEPKKLFFPETVQQVEEYEANSIGNPDINFPMDEMLGDLKKRMDAIKTVPSQAESIEERAEKSDVEEKRWKDIYSAIAHALGYPGNNSDVQDITLATNNVTEILKGATDTEALMRGEWVKISEMEQYIDNRLSKLIPHTGIDRVNAVISNFNDMKDFLDKFRNLKTK